MRRLLWIVLVFVCVAAVVAVGLSQTAWADKLRIGGKEAATKAPAQPAAAVNLLPQAAAAGGANSAAPAPTDSGSNQALTNAQERPQGTVPTGPKCVVTTLAGKFILGSIAEWTLDNVTESRAYQACVVKQNDLPAKQPAPLLTDPIELFVYTDPSLTVPQKICFPVPPNKDGFTWYWDGKAWVNSTTYEDNKACVTVPANVPAPTFVVVTKKQ